MMDVFVIEGQDAQSGCRRRMLRRLAGREGFLVDVRDCGATTCGPSMAKYLRNISAADGRYRMFELGDVAEGLQVTERQARRVAWRLRLDPFLYCMAEAICMLREVAAKRVG